ncbi:MAG: hypothetical protein ACEQSX_10960 [Baekduiaceae bacterium]
MSAHEVEVLVSGPAQDAIRVVTELGNSQALRMFMQDPAAVAAGDGRMMLRVQSAKSRTEAKSIVRAALDQVPGASAVVTIVEDDS